MMVGYKAKPRKTTYILSNEHAKPMMEAGDYKKRPQVILDYKYNSEKGGMDIADQTLKAYSTKCASRRWPLSAFFNLLDIVALNSYLFSKELGLSGN